MSTNTDMKLMFDMDGSPELVLEPILESGGQGGQGTTSVDIASVDGPQNKKYLIRGVFSTIGERNRNGRIYPERIWESEISRYQETLTNGSINSLMEYQHPARTEVDPMEAVAKITKLEINGKYIMGEAVLLNNAKANQLKSLIDNGIKISVSSRGVGSVKDGIVENYKLITYDIVTDPSDYNATMNGLVENSRLCEGVVQDKTFKFEDGQIIETDILESTPKEELESAIVEKFKSLLKDL